VKITELNAFIILVYSLSTQGSSVGCVPYKLNEYGEKHNENILEKVVIEGTRLKTEIAQKNDEIDERDSGIVHAATEATEPDIGRKIAFDNFDFKQNVHHMTETHQNIDSHWVSHMCTEHRVCGNHLSTVRPKNSGILDLDNGKFIPSKEEHMMQRQNYSILASQIIVRNIVCSHFLSQCAPQHIKHQYQSEMMKKTETVSSPLQMYYLFYSN
jgi:hypothetical protein